MPAVEVLFNAGLVCYLAGAMLYMVPSSHRSSVALLAAVEPLGEADG
jgi:hypothetical protein